MVPVGRKVAVAWERGCLTYLCLKVGLRRPYVRDAIVGEAEMKAKLTPPALLTSSPKENQAEAGI